VLSNLVANALKFGGGSPVRLTLRLDGDDAVIEVSDQGVGIDVADQGRIFERFERVGSSKERAGLGLGLYISRELVQRMGGRLDVQSEPGAGATFVVDLPRA
jgi:signal transduction histidine kinase